MRKLFIKVLKLISENRRGIKIAVAFILAILLLTWLTAGSISVFKTKSLLETKASYDSLKTEARKAIISDSVSFKLVKEISFKEALLEMSKQDSIGVILNLQDSTIRLSINGVIIHTSKASSVKKDPLIHRLDPVLQAILFANPEEIKEQYATIVKEPIVLRKAPKDTAEARINAWKPDTLIQNPAHLELTFGDGIRIVLNQDKNQGFKDWYVKNVFHFKRKFIHLRKNIKLLLRLKWFPYSPEIYIDLPADDLRSIFRALPEKAYVVVNY